MTTINPFGNPDGSRVMLENIMEDFITNDSKFFPIKNSNMRTRVIVGGKGSGKTLYLRRMQAQATSDSSVYATDIAHEIFETATVIKFCQLYDVNLLTEKWQKLWRCGILRSLTSHILYSSELNNYLTKEEKDDLTDCMNILIPKSKIKSRRALDVYSEVKNIVYQYDESDGFNNYFILREWDELEAILSEILTKLPPIYFFLDCIDDEYAHAPMYWMRCQKGLFYRCMRFLRDPKFGGRFHLVICIRDHVLSSVYQSEHASRYMNDDHITSLRWNYNAIEYFFDLKISKLNDCFFNDLNYYTGKSLKSWLGVDIIRNEFRNKDEPILQYILRHTRLTPRDIVEIGNELSKIKREAYDSASYDVVVSIRNKIESRAKNNGKELLTICANQINCNQMPVTAGRWDYSYIYTSVDEFKEQTSDKLKKALDLLPSDRITWQDIERVNNYIEETELLPRNHNFFNVLWQNGGIGYSKIDPNDPNNKKEEFFVDCNYTQFKLPEDKKEYLLRSCLVDYIEMGPRCSAEPVIGGTQNE